jgi:hypothetical protein
MTWANRAKPLAVGDRVAFTAPFLRNTGQYTGDVPRARGTVAALVPLGDTMLAEVDWNTPDMPRRVHVANLCRVNSRAFAD